MLAESLLDLAHVLLDLALELLPGIALDRAGHLVDLALDLVGDAAILISLCPIPLRLRVVSPFLQVG